jgi:hypothetical protein
MSQGRPFGPFRVVTEDVVDYCLPGVTNAGLFATHYRTLRTRLEGLEEAFGTNLECGGH